MGLFEEVVHLLDTNRLDEPVEAFMESDERLRHFWEFANETRRTASLGATASNYLRGLWLTDELVVQRIDGWGSQAVRILCVTCGSPPRKERLQRFFRADRQNMEAQLGMVQDPLEAEQRVLVKIPYNTSLQEPLLQEQRALRKLQGLPGIPVLYRPIWFKDLNLVATTLRYHTAPNLQKELESGYRLSLEKCHQLWLFLLRTLQQAHKAGVVHANLQPRDVLIDFGSSACQETIDEKEVASSNPSRSETPPAASDGGNSSARQTPDPGNTPSRGKVEVCALICGWTFTREIGKDAGGGSSLVQILDQLCTGETMPGAIGGGVGGSFDTYCLSLYSSPEQYLEAYSGHSLSRAATDLYRAAAVVAMALTGKSPVSNHRLARISDILRQLCHKSIARQQAEAVSFPEEERQAFRQCLQKLSEEPVDICWATDAPELRETFEKCLQRDPKSRCQTATDVLNLLEKAWASLQDRLQYEREMRPDPLAMTSAAKTGAEETESPSRRKRLVLEPPPELEHMHVL